MGEALKSPGKCRHCGRAIAGHEEWYKVILEREYAHLESLVCKQCYNKAEQTRESNVRVTE